MRSSKLVSLTFAVLAVAGCTGPRADDPNVRGIGYVRVDEVLKKHPLYPQSLANPGRHRCARAQIARAGNSAYASTDRAADTRAQSRAGAGADARQLDLAPKAAIVSAARAGRDTRGAGRVGCGHEWNAAGYADAKCLSAASKTDCRAGQRGLPSLSKQRDCARQRCGSKFAAAAERARRPSVSATSNADAGAGVAIKFGALAAGCIKASRLADEIEQPRSFGCAA